MKIMDEFVDYIREQDQIDRILNTDNYHLNWTAVTSKSYHPTVYVIGKAAVIFFKQPINVTSKSCCSTHKIFVDILYYPLHLQIYQNNMKVRITKEFDEL